jgi:hypothetical protein
MFAIRLIFPLLSRMQLQYIYLVCMSAIVTTDTHKADIHEITLLWSGAIPIKVEERRRKIILYEIHLPLPPTPFGLQFLACIRRLISSCPPHNIPEIWFKQDTRNEESGHVKIQRTATKETMKCRPLRRDARDEHYHSSNVNGSKGIQSQTG